MRLVEHPGAYFAMHQRIAEGGAAKLFRRDEDQPEVAGRSLSSIARRSIGLSRLLR